MLTRILTRALLVAGTLCIALAATAADESVRAQARALFNPLPTAMTSDENPITPEKVALGRSLTGKMPADFVEAPILPPSAFAGAPGQPAPGAGAPRSSTAAPPAE